MDIFPVIASSLRWLSQIFASMPCLLHLGFRLKMIYPGVELQRIDIRIAASKL